MSVVSVRFIYIHSVCIINRMVAGFLPLTAKQREYETHKAKVLLPIE